jgi:hypothetical protein
MKKIFVLFLFLFSFSILFAQEWKEIIKNTASDGSVQNYYGYAVAIDGDYAVVSATNENTDAAGSNPIDGAGAAYVLYRNQGGTNNWGEVKKLVPDDRHEDDYFGWSVSISNDIIVAGTFRNDYDSAGNNYLQDAGAAYVFYKDQGGEDEWGQVKKITPADRNSDDWFGYGVSVSNNIIAVSAYRQDYDAGGNNFIENAGAVYVFYKDQGGTDNWGLVKKIVPDTRTADYYFGYSLSISGDLLAVGEAGELHASGDYSGYAYIFQKDQGGQDNWGQVKKIVSSDRLPGDGFAHAVSLSGDKLAVGGYAHDYDENGMNPISNAGAVYIFYKNSGGMDNWGQIKKIVASDRQTGFFGWSVAISGNSLVVGMHPNGYDANGENYLKSAGAAYTFEQNLGGTDNWGQTNKIVASNRHEDNLFGCHTAISGDYAIIGARGSGLSIEGQSYVFRKFIQATNLVFTNVQTDRFSLVWTNGNGTSRAVFIKEGSSGGAQPEDGISYAANQTFGSGSQIASTGWYCVCNGTSSGTDVYGLKPGSTYRISVCEYINDPGSEIYSDQTALSNPSNQSTQVKDTHTSLIGIITNSAGDGTGGNGYGYSVSVDGDYAVVGAPYEQRDAAGGNAITSAGAAYILYRHQGGADQWGEIKKIVPGDRHEYDYFGYSVDINGEIVIVGAHLNDYDESGSNPITNAGAAYIFYKDQGGENNWGQVKKLLASPRNCPDARFGYSVSIHDKRVLVGAYGQHYNDAQKAGAAFIYYKDQGGTDNWGFEKKLIASDPHLDDNFGTTVSICSDHAFISSPYVYCTSPMVMNSGAVYVYRKDQGGTNNWGWIKKITANDPHQWDNFGYSLAFSEDRLVVGAVNNDYDEADGNLLSNAGSVYIFGRNSGGSNNWGQVKKLVPSDRHEEDYFGKEVSISGTMVLVGAYGNDYDQSGENFIDYSGASYVFYKDYGGTDQWGQSEKLVAGNRGERNYYGWSTGLSPEHTAIIGARGDGPAGGQVYIYEPVIEAGPVTFSNILKNSFTIHWQRGNGTNCTVFVKETDTVNITVPQDNTTYVPNAIFGVGSQIGLSGWYCVYKNTGTEVTVTGLDPDTWYNVAVYEYSGTAGSENYSVFDPGNMDNVENQITGLDLSLVGIHVGNGFLTATTTAMEYSLNSTNGTDGDWTTCTEPNTTVAFETGDVYIRHIPYPGNFIVILNIPPPAEPPAITIDFNGEKTAVIISSTVEYNYDNDFSTVNFSGPNNYLSLIPGTDVYFRTKATATELPGQILQLTVPERPVAPGFTIDYTNETTSESVDTIYEYAENPDMSDAVTAAGLPVQLIPGTDLFIRQKLTDTSFVGEIQELTVPARPAVNYSVDFANETTTEMISPEDEYSYDPDFNTSQSGNYQKILLEPGQDVYFRKKATTTSFLGETQHLSVPARPDFPVVSLSDRNSSTAVFMKSADGTGEQVGIGDGLEFSVSFGISFDPITPITKVDATGMKHIIVRKKSTAISFASGHTENLDYEKPAVSVVSAVACNGPDDGITVQSNLDNGKVYMIMDGEPQADVSELNAAISSGKAASTGVTSNETDIFIAASQLLPGTYHAYATNDWDSLSEVSAVGITIHGIPEVDLGEDIVKCKDTEVTLDPGSEYASYAWSYNAVTTRSIHVTDEDDYILTVTDDQGCKNSDTVSVRYNIPYDGEKICIVTVDLLTGRNLIVWEKTPGKGIEYYKLYRENTLMSTVPYDALSVFEDTVADPEKRPYLYRISIVDTCGNESAQSLYHKPLFLQYSSAEMGVNLTWSKYEIEGEVINFNSYTIYRGSDSTVLSPIEEDVPKEVDIYTDNDPNALTRKYFYRIAGNLTDPCYPSGSGGKKADTGPYSHSMSNMEDNRFQETPEGITSLMENEFKIIPNPFNETTTLMFHNPEGQSYTLYIMDLTGKVCRIVENINTPEYVLKRDGLKEGLYFLELRGPEVYREKIVIK